MRQKWGRRWRIVKLSDNFSKEIDGGPAVSSPTADTKLAETHVSMNPKP